MSLFNTETPIFICSDNKSPAPCHRAFMEKFSDFLPPNRRKIHKFNTTWSVLEIKELKDVLTAEKINDIRARLYCSPRKSLTTRR